MSEPRGPGDVSHAFVLVHFHGVVGVADGSLIERPLNALVGGPLTDLEGLGELWECALPMPNRAHVNVSSLLDL